MRLQRLGDRGGKTVAVHRQRPARRQLVGIGSAHHQRLGPAHFLVQQADSIVGPIVRAKGVGTDQLGQRVGLVGKGATNWPHFMQHHGKARLGRLPRRLRPRQTAANDMKFFRHGGFYYAPGVPASPENRDNSASAAKTL